MSFVQYLGLLDSKICYFAPGCASLWKNKKVSWQDYKTVPGSFVLNSLTVDAVDIRNYSIIL